jgi:hypothetical protein
VEGDFAIIDETVRDIKHLNNDNYNYLYKTDHLLSLSIPGIRQTNVIPETK